MIGLEREQIMDLRNRENERRNQSRLSEGNVLPDRRRPGRINDINPALYGLLRGNRVDGYESNDLISKNIPNKFYGECPDEDKIRETRGILNAIAISLLLWALIFGIFSLVFLSF